VRGKAASLVCGADLSVALRCLLGWLSLISIRERARHDMASSIRATWCGAVGGGPVGRPATGRHRHVAAVASSRLAL